MSTAITTHAHATPAEDKAPTPSAHASTSKAKPVRLLALDDGPQGKTALLEFPEGWQRTLGLPTRADAWHPLFSELPKEDVQRLRKHVAHPIIRHPDGTRTRRGAMSFVTEEVNRVGGWTGERYFDVPAEDYCAGSVTGYRCAAELLDALGRGYGPHVVKWQVIKAAVQASEEPHGEPSRCGAGTSFMEVIGDALTFMAKHSRHREFMAAKIAEAERWQATIAEREAKEKAAFVERMKAGRAAKRNRAAAGAPQIADA